MLHAVRNLQLQANIRPTGQLETNHRPAARRLPTSLERPAEAPGQRQGAENIRQEVREELEKPQGPSALAPRRGESPGKGQGEKTPSAVQELGKEKRI